MQAGSQALWITDCDQEPALQDITHIVEHWPSDSVDFGIGCPAYGNRAASVDGMQENRPATVDGFNICGETMWAALELLRHDEPRKIGTWDARTC